MINIRLFIKWHRLCVLYGMRKILLTALVTIGMIGSSVAQLAIPGEIFAQNPSRFNGRKVTMKNIELVSTQNLNGSMVSPAPLSPVSGPINVGQIGPVAPNQTSSPCRPPRGFSKVDIFFKGEPDFKACFFMSDAMKSQLNREMGGQNVEAQVTFRGDFRTGYNITFYRLGM